MPARKLTDRRLKALEAGSEPSPEELVLLVQLARIGRQLEDAPEVVVLSQGSGAIGDAPKHNTWTVDVGFDDDPQVAGLLGHRIKVIRGEQVIRTYKRGDGWPKDAGDPRLVPGARPPRNWV